MIKPTLLIMAAGLGSRYGSLKQIEPVGPGGEAIIDYSVFDAIRAGFGKVVFVIKKDIEKDFRGSLLKRFEKHIETSYVFQELDMLPEGYSPPPDRLKPWGTAHAILVSESEITTPFAALNADDFYGYDAFGKMNDFLSGNSADTDYCMIGYRLKNTLSEHGTVSRGVCETDNDNYLVSVRELVKIKEEAGKIIYLEDNESTPLPAEAIVSMNMWGFKPTVFQKIRERFAAFLSDSMHDPKAEFYIPTLVDLLIRSGEARVKVVPTDSSWFGITYKEDREAARQGVLRKIDEGEYPLKLWK